MPSYEWQKSSFSAEAANCLYIATDHNTIKIRESDSPNTILTTAPEALKALILKAKAKEFTAS